MSMTFVRCGWMLLLMTPNAVLFVSLDGSLGLLVAHLVKELAHRYGFAGVDI